MNGKRENSIMLIWSVFYFFVLFMSAPVKGDQFAQIPVIYAYMSATFLMFWFLRLVVKIITLRLTLKMSVLILSFAVLYPATSLFLNSRGHFICNAAEYNYPTVLYLFLDRSNEEQMELAKNCALSNTNQDIKQTQ